MLRLGATTYSTCLQLGQLPSFWPSDSSGSFPYHRFAMESITCSSQNPNMTLLADWASGVQLVLDMEAQEHSWARLPTSLPWQSSIGGAFQTLRLHLSGCTVKGRLETFWIRQTGHSNAGFYTIHPLRVSLQLAQEVWTNLQAVHGTETLHSRHR